jgi:glycosyltransferase involved in cell wall biosynthesis
MQKLKNNNIIYYVPVDLEYFDKWEYYKVDLKMLRDAHDNVYISNNILSFLSLIFSKKINLVYFWWFHSSCLIVLLSKLFRKKIIGTGAVHMFDESGALDFYKKSFLFRLANRITWKFADKNLFISESQLRQITSHEKVNNPYVLKSSSIHDANELFKISKNKTPNVKINMLIICWLTKDQIIRKSIPIILKAISKLSTDEKDIIKLTIAGGSGDGIKFLKKQIKELNITDFINIEIDITNSRKQQLYIESDLYIQPSYYEGFGNAVLEAMTYGTPCLVSSYTAQPEVVRSSGYIINNITTEEVFNAIKSHISKSDFERKELISNVRDTVINHHGYDKRLKEYLSLFKQEDS